MIPSKLLGDPEDLIVVSSRDRRGQPLKTVLDRNTAIVRNDPVPSDKELEEFYVKEYRKEYKSSGAPHSRQLLRNFRRGRDFFRRHEGIVANAKNVLDAGAGTGGFLFAAAFLGKDAIGVEPGEQYAEFCRRELGLDVRSALFSKDLFDEESFDLILLNHVLEHINDPVRALKMLRGWMKPEGLLYIEVPDIIQMAHFSSPGNIFHYGHIWNFSPETLSAVAGLAGLQEYQRVPAISNAATAIFFKKGDVAPFPNLSNMAQQTLESIETHYKGSLSRSRLSKPFVKAARRFEEWLTVKRYRNPAEMGRGVMSE